MGFNLIINKTAIATSYSANTVVATAIVIPITDAADKYTYNLTQGSSYYDLSNTGVLTVKALMNLDNIQPFVIQVVDNTGYSLSSPVLYPNIRTDIRLARIFNKENSSYDIIQNIDLKKGALAIPYNCNLHFRGGKISNGSLILSSTSIENIGNLNRYFTNVNIEGTYRAGQIIYNSDSLFNEVFDGTDWRNLDGTLPSKVQID